MQQPPIPTQPTQKRRWYNDKDLFLYGFVRSNYVTAFTDWFMGLAGKLAEFVLYATVLYSGAELYPGVTLPESLNLSVFILQMGALDIGGIGLSKLAKQARDDGNLEGAEKAENLSKWLIRIMIAGIVTVSAEQVIARLPGAQAARPAIQIVQAMVELVLVVARAICAVLYGKVVHALKKATPEPAQQIQQDEQAHLLADLHTQFAQEQQRTRDLAAKLETAHLHLADLTAKWHTANVQIADLQHAAKEAAQQPSAPSAPSQSTRKITSIDQARAKHHASQGKAQRISYTEVLAYIAKHPDLKRAEVAAQLGISERKVYGALAWEKERDVAAHS